MSFNPAAVLACQIAHDAQLAMTPGWWTYTQTAVAALEADDSAQGLWNGLHAGVAAVVKAARFKPAPHELVPLWIEKNQGVLL